jgi:hypothetical protein
MASPSGWARSPAGASVQGETAPDRRDPLFFGLRQSFWPETPNARLKYQNSIKSLLPSGKIKLNQAS